jgi:hypothetical protein
MVLTEDDYLDFLMNCSHVPEIIPPRVEQAFTESSLLFLGFSLEDMNFKVIFRRLSAYLQRSQAAHHVSVQLAPQGYCPAEAPVEGQPPDDPETAARKKEEAQAKRKAYAKAQEEYLRAHFGLQRVKIYFGTCEEFCAELRRRWEEFRAKKQ